MAGIPTCTTMPAAFLELLASTIMVNAAGEIQGLNCIIMAPTACDCVPLIDCDNNHLTPEEHLRNIFALDNCGKLAIKLVNCDGTAGFTREQ